MSFRRFSWKQNKAALFFNMRFVMFKSLIAAIALVFSATVANAQGSSYAGNVAGWDVGIDNTVHGCFAVRNYTDGSIVRIGINARTNTAYFLFGNVNWNPMLVGDVVGIHFIFDNSRE